MNTLLSIIIYHFNRIPKCHIKTSTLKKKKGFRFSFPCCFLDPRPWPEGSYEIGSVCPSILLSFCLSVSFLGFGSLFFSETQHEVRGPCISVCHSRIFWKMSSSGKNDQKWPRMAQKVVFGLFKKIMPLVLSGIFVK